MSAADRPRPNGRATKRPFFAAIPLWGVIALPWLAACAREAQPAAGPAPALVYAEGSSTASDDIGIAPVARYRFRASSASIEGGEACLGWLARRGVAFQVLDPKPGMTTPISVRSELGGVTFKVQERAELVCDCRLAAVLEFLKPEFRRLGITTIYHSGAYAYRTTRKGRLSLHALGLAVDVHQVEMGGHRFSVTRDYRRGNSPRTGVSQCGANAALNLFACDMNKTRLFQELLTPDDNADHYDHLHLAIAPFSR